MVTTDSALPTKQEVALARALLAAGDAWQPCPALAAAAGVPARSARHLLARLAREGVVECVPAHPGPRYRLPSGPGRVSYLARVDGAAEVLGMDPRR